MRATEGYSERNSEKNESRERERERNGREEGKGLVVERATGKAKEGGPERGGTVEKGWEKSAFAFQINVDDGR